MHVLLNTFLLLLILALPHEASAEDVNQLPEKLSSSKKEERLKSTRDALVEGLTADSAEVRESSAEALAGLGDSGVIPALMAASDKNSYVIPVIKGFGSKAVGHLLESLGSDTLSIRELAASLLGDLEDLRAIPRLVKALGNTPRNPPLALLKFGDKAVKDLIKGLEGKNESTRRACAVLLGEIGNPKAVDPLIEATAFGEEEPVEALIRIGRPAVVSLNKHLRSSDSTLRHAVTRIVGQIADSRSISILFLTAKDSDAGIRKDAIYALGLIGYRPALYLILKGMESTDPGVFEESKTALIRYGKKYLIQKLLKRYPYFIKWMSDYIKLITSPKTSSSLSDSSREPESEEEIALQEQIIRYRIRLYEILTFHSDAIKTFDELRKVTVLDEKDHYHMARIYYQEGKIRQMLEKLKQSLLVNPEYDKSLFAVRKLGYEYKHGYLRKVEK